MQQRLSPRHTTATARAELGALLLAAMPLPDENVSEEQFARAYHYDVEPAPTADLEREQAGLNVLLFFAPDAHDWFYMREAVIRVELEKRRT